MSFSLSLKIALWFSEASMECLAFWSQFLFHPDWVWAPLMRQECCNASISIGKYDCVASDNWVGLFGRSRNLFIWWYIMLCKNNLYTGITGISFYEIINRSLLLTVFSNEELLWYAHFRHTLAFYHHVMWDACNHVAVEPQLGLLPTRPQEASASAFLYLQGTLSFQRCSAPWNVRLVSHHSRASLSHTRSWRQWSLTWPEESTYVVHWGLQRSFGIWSLYREWQRFL